MQRTRGISAALVPAAIAGAVMGSGCRSQTGAPNALAAPATPPAAVQTTKPETRVYRRRYHT